MKNRPKSYHALSTDSCHPQETHSIPTADSWTSHEQEKQDLNSSFRNFILIAKPVPRTSRPLSCIPKPYIRSCSALCNHPVGQKTMLSFFVQKALKETGKDTANKRQRTRRAIEKALLAAENCLGNSSTQDENFCNGFKTFFADKNDGVIHRHHLERDLSLLTIRNSNSILKENHVSVDIQIPSFVVYSPDRYQDSPSVEDCVYSLCSVCQQDVDNSLLRSNCEIGEEQNTDGLPVFPEYSKGPSLISEVQNGLLCDTCQKEIQNTLEDESTYQSRLSHETDDRDLAFERPLSVASDKSIMLKQIKTAEKNNMRIQDYAFQSQLIPCDAGDALFTTSAKKSQRVDAVEHDVDVGMVQSKTLTDENENCTCEEPIVNDSMGTISNKEHRKKNKRKNKRRGDRIAEFEEKVKMTEEEADLKKEKEKVVVRRKPYRRYGQNENELRAEIDDPITLVEELFTEGGPNLRRQFSSGSALVLRQVESRRRKKEKERQAQIEYELQQELDNKAYPKRLNELQKLLASPLKSTKTREIIDQLIQEINESKNLPPKLDEKILVGPLGLCYSYGRFEIPMDTSFLKSMTPLAYLRDYCIPSRTMTCILKRSFDKHKTEDDILPTEVLHTAINEVLGQELHDDMKCKFTELSKLEANTCIDFKIFTGLILLASRILCFFLLPHLERKAQKNVVEKLDFSSFMKHKDDIIVESNTLQLLKFINEA